MKNPAKGYCSIWIMIKNNPRLGALCLPSLPLKVAGCAKIVVSERSEGSQTALGSSGTPLILPVSEFTRIVHTKINENIVLKYRSFAGQTNPARLRMTKMWGLHSNLHMLPMPR